MAAPTATAPTKPSGEFLERGYRTAAHIAALPGINLFCKSLKPPGLDGGDPIDTTTQWNDKWRTMVPEALITLTAMTFKAAYDPDIYDEGELEDLINIETTITLLMPDTSKVAFYGFVQKWDPDEMQEKEQPTGTLTIQPTNQDPDDQSEEPPVYVAPTGT